MTYRVSVLTYSRRRSARRLFGVTDRKQSFTAEDGGSSKTHWNPLQERTTKEINVFQCTLYLTLINIIVYGELIFNVFGQESFLTFLGVLK